MERDLQNQLDDRSWLRRDTESIENQWRSQVLPHFERNVKPGFDISEGLEGSEHFALYGLNCRRWQEISEGQDQGFKVSLCFYVSTVSLGISATNGYPSIGSGYTSGSKKVYNASLGSSKASLKNAQKGE